MNKLLLLLLLAASTYCRAQISAYSFASSTGTFTEISGGTVVPALATGIGVSDTLPIGFPFVFNGVAYTKVIAAGDGYLSFNPSATAVALNNLATGPVNLRPMLAPLWDDLGGAAAYSTFRYVTTGTTGSRVFTAQWRWFTWSYINALTISFQVKLYEGTNRIEYLYRPESYPPANASASIGIAGSSTGVGNFLALNNLVASPIVSSTVDSGNVRAKPDTIRLYSFTPPPPPATDLAISEVSIPTVICPTTSLPVSVTLYNGGSNPISFSGSPATISLNVTGPNPQNLSVTLNSGSLAAGATQVVSLQGSINVSAGGAYTFRSSATVAGDGNRGNDTLTTAATIASAASPWSERFATNAVPNGWIPNGWTVNYAADNTAVLGNPGSYIFKRIGADTAAAFTVIPVGPVAATDRLSFDYKVFNAAAPSDLPAAGWGHFKVQISTDCGATFTTLDTVANAAATLGWDFASFSLAAYAGQYVTVRILPKWRRGLYYLGFDNFKIKTPSPTDMAVSGISLITGNCPGGSVPVSVTVRNDGTNPIDFSAANTALILRVSGAMTQTITTTLNSGTLAVGATRSVPMPTNLNLSAAGSYYFDTYQTTAGDGDRTNDTSSTKTYVNRPTAALPWNEGFSTTSTPTGWSTGGWQIFALGGANGNPGYNIFRYFSTAGTLWDFYTIPVGPVTTGSILRFDHKVSADASPYGPPVPGWGYFKIQASPGCNNVYTTIDSVTTADSGWITKSYPLAAYAGQTVAFRMQAVCLQPDYVVAFDNFQVSSPAATDLAATSLTTPAGQCPLPAAPVTFGVKNVGTTTINFASTPATVTVNVGGAAPQTLTVTVDTGILAPVATRTVTLPPANLSAPGTYSFKGFVSLPADANRSNDTATAGNVTIASVSTVPAPWLEDFTPAALPAGWTATGWSVGTYRGANGNPGNNIYKTIGGGSPEGVITTPAIGPLPAGSYLSFDFKITETYGSYYPATIGFGNFKVQISSNCGGSFTDLENVNTAENGWGRKTYSLAAYAGQKVILRIAATNLYTAYDFAFDNFRVYTLPVADLSVTALSLADYVCPVFDVPIGIVVKNNGPDPFDFGNSPVTATIRYSAPDEPPPARYEDSFKTVVSSGIIPSGGSFAIPITNQMDPFFPGTYIYQCSITVNPLVDANRSNDTLTETRVTGSAAPWGEPFATTAPPPLIITNGWLVGAERGASGNPGYNLYRTMNADSSNQPFQTKTFGRDLSGQYLRFDYKVSDVAQPYGPPPPGWGNFKVQISRDCNTFVTVDSITTTSTGWITKTYPLSSYGGNGIRLQIKPQWKAGSYDLAFDNFRINVPGTCATPSGYTDQRTDSTVRVVVAPNTNNTIIEYGPFGFVPGTGGNADGGTIVTTTNPSVVVRGLTPGTGYVFYLRQNCSSTLEGYSSNVKVDSFITPLTPIALTNDLPANAIRLNVGAGCAGAYTINGATQSSGEPAVSCAGSVTGGKIVWFKFAAPANGFVKVSTDATANTLRDTKAALFTATDSSLFSTFQIMACDDDNGVLSDGASIFYATGLVPGRNYYVAVDGFNASDTGRFCISVSAADSSMIAPYGSCISSQPLQEQLPAYRGWVSATNYSGQLIANLRSNTTLPGLVSYYSFVNINTDSVRKAATNEYYLDRNFSVINNFPTTAGAWEVQLFFLNKEMRNLQAYSPTATLSNLNVTRGKDSLCRSTFLNGNADSLLLQSTSGTISGISWVTAPTTKLSSFYLNPGTLALPRLYVFTGSGMWSNPANWSNGAVPPAMLPPNSAIEIKPTPGGQCILDVNQRISDGDRLRIMSGTNVVIPGSVIIQQ